MNTSGEKFVKWVTIKDAVVELTNMYPGTVGPMGWPWYGVSITMKTENFSHRPTESLMRVAANESRVNDLNNILIRDDIVRVSWDYNHLWDTESSYKLWKIQADRFIDEMEALLASQGNAYYVQCQRCNMALKSDQLADVSGIPGSHFWTSLCVNCEKIVRSEFAV